MATVINTQAERKSDVLSVISAVLPYKLADELRKVFLECRHVEELRCRRDRRACVTVSGKSIILNYVTDGNDMENIMSALCHNSVYAFKDTILEGYITVECGIRAGVCGRAVTDGGKLLGVYDISGLNIRFPSDIRNIGEPVCRLLREGCGGVLIYSPPGVGKTTLLKSVIRKLSSGACAKRVSVIDTRGELNSFLVGETLFADVLVGYPRSKGIEIATRTMGAELIVCDEIGDPAEADAIISATNCGVPFIATAHGSSVKEIMKRTGIKKLHDSSVFEYYVGIKRRTGCTDFEYTVDKRENVDEHS